MFGDDPHLRIDEPLDTGMRGRRELAGRLGNARRRVGTEPKFLESIAQANGPGGTSWQGMENPPHVGRRGLRGHDRLRLRCADFNQRRQVTNPHTTDRPDDRGTTVAAQFLLKRLPDRGASAGNAART